MLQLTINVTTAEVVSIYNNANICAWPCVLRTALLDMVNYHLERGGMPLHDAVGITVTMSQLLKIKEQVSGIWA